MASKTSVRLASLCLPAAVLLCGPAGAQFVVDGTPLPTSGGSNGSSTENVDFGDVDLDGDWDVAMADGGDNGNDQNRLWINLGGLQAGVLGDFVDETSLRFPVTQDDSRDVEFLDFDNDGDLDLHVSNTADLSNQGNRWWTNLGGVQLGTLGFYVDETAARWVGLGGPGSSIHPGLLVGGTFIDWSNDTDFGDLDNDGDLDVVHSTSGSFFSGCAPTRIFLNDGDGRFQEFNPSGFQLPGACISDGDPGLWCDGTQLSNTTDFTGATCDIATTTLDVDVGDFDGDFDLDILHGARNEVTRFFANRLEASATAPAMGGGQLGFRDVTGLVYPPGYAVGTVKFEQEPGDLDLDGDLDVYGLNWGFLFNDITLHNPGNGIFDSVNVIPGTATDDNEGDFLDYDNDGDLDLFVANFSGADHLHRNDNTGAPFFSFTPVPFPNAGVTSLDGEVADTDGDGDYDILVAADNFTANVFYRNVTDVPDLHAPYIPNVETIGNQTAAAPGVPVRAQVYDNAPYYTTWYNPTTLEVTVDGCDLPPIPAASSQGQIFRAELPGNLVGNVGYRFRSSDQYANSGVSASRSYTGSTTLGFSSSYGTGTAGSLGEPEVRALSVPFAGSTFYLAGSNAPAGVFYVLVLAPQAVTPPFQLGNLALLNVTGAFFYLLETGFTDGNGCAATRVELGPTLPPGFNGFAQFFTLDGVVDVFASSKGLTITSQ